MQHMVAFQQSVDSATLTAINNVQDDIVTRNSATRFQVPADLPNIHYGMALGANLTRAVLVAPSLEVRRMVVDILPHRRGSEALTLTGPELWLPPSPIGLVGTEDIEAQVSEDAAGASQVDVLVQLGDGRIESPPNGDLRLVRLTGTTTLVARAWTTVTLTPERAFEPGKYTLVGMYPISATCIAARALFVGQVYRPGSPGFAGTEAAARDFDPTVPLLTSMYPMGNFEHNTVFSAQFFASAADTTETVLALVVKTG